MSVILDLRVLAFSVPLGTINKMFCGLLRINGWERGAPDLGYTASIFWNYSLRGNVAGI